MNCAQFIEDQEYSESARYDRFDGFDRGDLDNDRAEWLAAEPGRKSNAARFAALSPEAKAVELLADEIEF